jgi:IS5 family transposase
LLDEALPIEVRELPEDLARLDELLSDPALLVPIERGWEAEARDRGRPSIALTLVVRLMVIRQRTGWDVTCRRRTEIPEAEPCTGHTSR